MVVPVLSLTETVPGPGTLPKKAACADFLPNIAMIMIERPVEPTSLRNKRRLSSDIPVVITSPSIGVVGMTSCALIVES